MVQAQWEKIEPVVPSNSDDFDECCEMPLQLVQSEVAEEEETMPLQAVEISEDFEEGSVQIASKPESGVKKQTPNTTPCMRGGHQMCLDPQTETIYLFGGWDGRKDLADFWTFHIPSRTWTLLCENTGAEV